MTATVLAIAQARPRKLLLRGDGAGLHIEILAIGDTPDHKAIEVALPLTTVSTRRSTSCWSPTSPGRRRDACSPALVGLLIARAAVAPIRRFTARTEAVTSSLEHPKRLEETGPQELRRLAASFNQTLDALERSVEAQRHLIADASHELRTPMAALRSNIQIFLDSRALPDDERQELQDAIVAELDELTQLVADVLALARGSSSSDQSNRSSSMDLVARRGDRTHAGRPRRLRVGHRADGDRKLARAGQPSGHQRHRQRPQVELPTAGIEVSVRTGSSPSATTARGSPRTTSSTCSIASTAPTSARRLPGSGLGLAIVKQAAETHGGSVDRRQRS